MFRAGHTGLRGEQALGDWPGFANLMVSGRSYLAGPPGTSTSSTNTTVMPSDVIIGVVAYIFRPCTISSLTLRTSSSNASVGASVRLGIYACLDTGLPGHLISQNSAGSAIGDSATNTNITQSLDNPVIITEPSKIFIVSQHTATTTGARFSVASSLAPFVTYEGANSVANAITAVGICGFKAVAPYSSGLPSTFGTPSIITTLAEAHSAAFTLA